MTKYDFIALEYKLKHARSKRAVIDSYPELKELKKKTIKEVMGLLAINTMVMTGKSPEEQKRLRNKQYYFLRKYGKN